MSAKKIAVAGATGRVGHHVVGVLTERGYEVVPMSRSDGVDVISGEGLAAALDGVDTVIDTATGPSAEQQPATEFFTTAARNLQQAGQQAGVRHLVVVSIIGTDRFSGGYGAAKVAHERAALAGPVPARILRAAQFHEFVGQLVDWGTQGDVAYVPNMRTQLVAARTVAETLADIATGAIDAAPAAAAADDAGRDRRAFLEVAGPREESMVEMATLLASRRGHPAKIEGVSDPSDVDGVNESGGLLPGPGAILAGPTFRDWLDAAS
jgi:uncharacterized protein YbjT (DUF2867 family)